MVDKWTSKRAKSLAVVCGAGSATAGSRRDTLVSQITGISVDAIRRGQKELEREFQNLNHPKTGRDQYHSPRDLLRYKVISEQLLRSGNC